MIDEATLYCTFRSHTNWYGIPVLDVKEVTTETTYTRIPHAPKEVLGFVNIRGHIYLALELGNLLGVSSHCNGNPAQLVLFKPTVGAAFGIAVDEVGEIMSIPNSQREEFSGVERFEIDPADRGVLVSHICKTESTVLIVLDPRKFLPCIEQSLHASITT